MIPEHEEPVPREGSRRSGQHRILFAHRSDVARVERENPGSRVIGIVRSDVPLLIAFVHGMCCARGIDFESLGLTEEPTKGKAPTASTVEALSEPEPLTERKSK